MSPPLVCESCVEVVLGAADCEYCGRQLCRSCFGRDRYACAWCIDNGYAQPDEESLEFLDPYELAVVVETRGIL